MNKKGYLKVLKELETKLVDASSREAIDHLKKAIYNLEEEVAPKSNSHGSFVLPREVEGKSHALALFTDGACRGNPGPGSYGYLVQGPNGDILGEGKEAFEHTTNNRMEMSAIIKGLEFLITESMVTPMHEIYVYTDSKYVVDGMKSWVAGWKRRGWKKADKKTPENVELWQKLDSLRESYQVSFNWVKGHAGHPQNEHVDQLANIALDESGY